MASAGSMASAGVDGQVGASAGVDGQVGGWGLSVSAG
jgi:hypothetical protein